MTDLSLSSAADFIPSAANYIRNRFPRKPVHFPQRTGSLACRHAAYSDRIAQAFHLIPLLYASCILSALYLSQCSIQTGFRQQNIPYRVSLLTGCSSCQMKLRIQNLLLSLQNFIRQKLLFHVIEAETFDGRSETFAGNALLPIQENRLFNHV